MNDTLQIRGRVYYKDDRVVEKPRALTELLIPKAIVEENRATMADLLNLAEERLAFDIAEINSTSHDAGIDELREAMAR
jgi:hypothetical protein